MIPKQRLSFSRRGHIRFQATPRQRPAPASLGLLLLTNITTAIRSQPAGSTPLLSPYRAINLKRILLERCRTDSSATTTLTRRPLLLPSRSILGGWTTTYAVIIGSQSLKPRVIIRVKASGPAFVPSVA